MINCLTVLSGFSFVCEQFSFAGFDRDFTPLITSRMRMRIMNIAGRKTRLKYCGILKGGRQKITPSASNKMKMVDMIYTP